MAQQQKNPAHTVEPLDGGKELAAALPILDVLRRGLAQIRARKDSIVIERTLSAQPTTDGRAERRRGLLTGGSRNDQLRARLAKNRAIAPSQKPEPAMGDLPPAVSLALEVCNSTRSAPALLDSAALLAQLTLDESAVEKGIAEQSRLIERLRDERRYAQNLKDEAAWFALQKTRLQRYQEAAAIDDQMRDFQQARFNAGYGFWRADLLPELGMRVALTLGSERDHTSEVSKMRQRLEELRK